MKKQLIVLTVLVLSFLSLTTFFANNLNNTGIKGAKTEITTAPLREQAFSYQGKDNIDALTLLQQQAKVKQSEPGFVTSINGLDADPDKKEFWSFYVNGKMAPVGAGEYLTKDTDLIEWKLENY